MNDSVDTNYISHPHAMRTLYVTLRGEFAIYTENNHLRVLAPTIDTDESHDLYAAGPWMEHPPQIPKGRRLTLRHAIGDTRKPEDCSDLFMKLGPMNPDPTGARLDITLPLPIAILPGLIEDTKTVYIDVTNADGSHSFPRVPAHPTVIPILVYGWQPDHENHHRYPYLQDEDDHDQIWRSGNDGTPLSDYYRVIHIFATSSCKPEPKEHAQAAFAAAAKLLGITARIDWNNGSPGNSTPVTPAPGLLRSEANAYAYQMYKLTTEQLSQGAVRITRIQEDGDGNCGPVTG